MIAIGLLSGGLDSALAVKLMLEQGLEVIALKFSSPFCQCSQGGGCQAATVALQLGVPLVHLAKGDDYLEVVRAPKHGYGVGMNPCIDCRIFMLRAAWRYAETAGASFMFTGEVLGQRPMSQKFNALRLIEREAGVEGRLLRPLSAGLLPETEIERQGWVDRKRLLQISGRSRATQLAEAERYELHGYSCPAGGCLLTDRHFASRLRESLKQGEELTMARMPLLKAGRHFRHGGSRIVVGRNEPESLMLEKWQPAACRLEPLTLSGPTTVVTGTGDGESIRFAADITAAYTDGDDGQVLIRCRTAAGEEVLTAGRRPRGEYGTYAI